MGSYDPTATATRGTDTPSTWPSYRQEEVAMCYKELKKIRKLLFHLAEEQQRQSQRSVLFDFDAPIRMDYSRLSKEWRKMLKALEARTW